MRRLHPLQIAGILLLIGVIWFVSGYRFSLAAAVSHHHAVRQPWEPVAEVALEWGKVVMLETPDGPRTLVCEGGPLAVWRCPGAWTFEAMDPDPVRMVGAASFSSSRGAVTVLAVQTDDPAVAFIEAGPESGDRIRKPIAPGQIVVFDWPQALLNQTKPVALAADGTPLYEYRYPNTAAVRSNELRWYPIE